MKVRVADAAGNPVSGVTVTFTAPSIDPSGAFSGLSSAIAVSDSTGVATAPQFRAGAVTGQYQITASFPGVIAPAVFHVTNIAPVPVTFTTSPAGLSYVLDGNVLTGTQTLDLLPGSPHTLTSVSQVNGAGNIRYNPAAWDSGVTSGTYVVPPAGPAGPVTGTFAPLQYLLIVNPSPAGAGTAADNHGATVGSGGLWYDANSALNLTASANSGYVFSQFSFALTTSPADVTTSSNPMPLLIDGPKTVVANFTPLAPALAMNVTGKSIAGGHSTWTVRATNNGPGPALGAQITGVTISGGTVDTTFPLDLGTITSGSSVTGTFTFTIPSVVPFTLTINYFDGVQNRAATFKNLRN
jgi:hypothetical protein